MKTQPTTVRETRQAIKSQGKAATRKQLALCDINIETILGTNRGLKPRIILITWHSYVQTAIPDTDRALEYIIANFDNIETIDYVDFETV
tara:strand:+ start:7865 stop:8134 length:270 start_codon:yes stop_codon:yes gene_type:complete